MKYSLETSRIFDKQFKQLDRYTQKIIKSWIDKNLVELDNPRSKGKALLENHKGKWRYRIGEYRLICSIEDEKLIILALSIGH